MRPVGPMSDGKRTVYAGIMGGPLLEGGLAAPASWSSRNGRRGPRDAGISVHSAVCVVNSKAVDTTRNTLVRMYNNRVPMAGRGDGVPWTTPRTLGCTTGSSAAR